MRAGIDLDEVLVEFVPSLLAFYKQLSGRQIRFEDIKSYNFWESGVGRNREEAIELTDAFFQSEFFNKLSLIEGAKEAVFQLSREGIVFIVTSRPSKVRSQTKDFLRKNFPDINGEAIYTGDFHKGQGKTKAEICKELGIEEFYEDNINYARECSPYVHCVYLFNKPWNQKNVDGNIVRVQGWKEALQRRENEYK